MRQKGKNPSCHGAAVQLCREETSYFLEEEATFAAVKPERTMEIVSTSSYGGLLSAHQGLMPERSHSSSLFPVINSKLLLTLLLHSGLKCIRNIDGSYPISLKLWIHPECQQNCPGQDQNATESIFLLFPDCV